MTFQALQSFSLGSGLLYFIGLFAIVVCYALRPGNRARFERAARMPLDQEERSR